MSGDKWIQVKSASELRGGLTVKCLGMSKIKDTSFLPGPPRKIIGLLLTEIPDLKKHRFGSYMGGHLPCSGPHWECLNSIICFHGSIEDGRVYKLDLSDETEIEVADSIDFGVSKTSPSYPTIAMARPLVRRI